jgi:hypothetical protein
MQVPIIKLCQICNLMVLGFVSAGFLHKVSNIFLRSTSVVYNAWSVLRVVLSENSLAVSSTTPFLIMVLPLHG